MPLQKLQFRPGVNREGTTLANEGGWFESDKVRFRSGYPEKIGGWVKDSGSQFNSGTAALPPTGSFWGVCRSMINWLNLAGYNLLGLGTNLKYYIQNTNGGNFYDVTPLRATDTVASNAFTTSDTLTTVQVNDNAHGAQPGDFVTISGVPSSTLNGSINASVTSITVTSAAGFPASGTLLIDSEKVTYSGISTNTFTGCTRGVNGTTATSHSSGAGVYIVYNGIPASDLNKEFRIDSIVSNNAYTITVDTPATSTGTTGAATFTYQINTGSDIYTTGVGWGAGGWGGATTGYPSTGWGSPAPAGLGIGIQLRTWSNANFGENLVINPRGGAMYFWAVNPTPNTFDRAQYLGPSQTITLKNYATGIGTTTVTVDATCPTIVNRVLVSDASRFLIAFGCNDPTGEHATINQDPMQIRWTDQESFSTWTPAITNQAGGYRLSSGSEIITALQTRQEILIWTDVAIYSMQFLGAPYVWGFQIMGDNISIIGPNSAVTVNNVTYWMGADKFYMYSGRVETLPCSLRQYVYDDINLQQGFQVFGGTNEGYNEIWWFYCSANSTVVDKYVIYNHLERTWAYGTLSRSAWLDSPLRATPMAAGYGGLLIYQENGNDDGTTNPPTPITAYIQSSDFDIGDGHNFGLVNRIIPDITFDGSTVNNPSTNFEVRPRQFPGTNYGNSQDPAVASTQNYQLVRTYNVQQFTEQVFVRLRGRQMALRVTSDTLGVAWQLGVPRIEIRPDGRR